MTTQPTEGIRIPLPFVSFGTQSVPAQSSGQVQQGSTPPNQQILAVAFEKFISLPLQLQDSFRPGANSTTYGLQSMADCRQAENIVLIAYSSCNQALTLRVVGSENNTPQQLSSLVNIGTSQSISDGSSSEQIVSFGVNLRGADWFPFIGMTIATGGTAPTTGRIIIRAIVRQILTGGR